jgi:phosphatidylserine/phosphatidylglycerophosphate/cardiolipin synthase-like enzyme
MRHIFRGLFLAVVISAAMSALRPGHSFTSGLWQSLPRCSTSFWLPTGTDTVRASSSPLALHFSPTENLEHFDIEVIRQSRSHLDIAMYAFTDQAIARAVAEVATRGVHVRIYRDREQYQQEQARNSYIADLFRGNPNIEIRVKKSRTLMHLKQYWTGQVLRDGSANMSPSGLKAQNNSLTLTTNADDIRLFQANFNEMWGRSDNIVIQ